MIPAKILERKPRLRFNFEEGTFSKTNETFHGKRGWKMENTGFYVIPNKTQYEIGERVWLEIKKNRADESKSRESFVVYVSGRKSENGMYPGTRSVYSTCGKHFRKNGWISGKNRILSKD